MAASSGGRLDRAPDTCPVRLASLHTSLERVRQAESVKASAIAKASRKNRSVWTSKWREVDGIDELRSRRWTAVVPPSAITASRHHASFQAALAANLFFSQMLSGNI